MTRSQFVLKGFVASIPPTLLVAAAMTDPEPAWIAPAVVSVLTAVVAEFALPEGPSVAWLAVVCFVLEIGLVVAGCLALHIGGAL